MLISGRGSNLQALIDACAAESFPAEIALVLSNVAGAAGLERAEARGIATTVIDHKAYETREAFEDAMHEALSGAGSGTGLPRRLHAAAYRGLRRAAGGTG